MELEKNVEVYDILHIIIGALKVRLGQLVDIELEYLGQSTDSRPGRSYIKFPEKKKYFNLYIIK